VQRRPRADLVLPDVDLERARESLDDLTDIVEPDGPDHPSAYLLDLLWRALHDGEPLFDEEGGD